MVAGLLLATSCGSTPVSNTTQTSSDTVYGGGLAGQTIDAGAWDRAVDQVRSDTVLVHNLGCDLEATGSAVAISPDELVTNRHVVEGARQLSIETASGRRVAVQSWQVSETDDLALLRLPDQLFHHPVTLAAEPTIPGNLIVVMGYPLGGPLTVGRGRVLKMTPDPGGSGQAEIEASVDILPGNSGGPLVDTHGQVVGVIRAIDLESGSALAIPAARVKDLLSGKSTQSGRPC
jgi:S1-C subfamily serine protease